MNVDPLVSVVIPVFDTRPEYLAEALNSVVAQTLDSDLIEVIIVDDFSSNPITCEFLDTIGADDFYQGVKIRVIRHDKNRWLAQARNT